MSVNQGYGYADYNQRSTNQYIYNASANETGYTGYYQITGTSNYGSNTFSLNQVYVTSYYNTENSTSYTPYSGYSSVGLGNESGYIISGDKNSYFSTYYEADITTLMTIDLKSYSFFLSSTSLTVDNTFNANFGVQNLGNGSAGSFYVMSV